MAVYRFEGEIGEDHRLEIPKEIPTGRARIVVMPEEAEKDEFASFRALVKEMAAGPHHTRTRDEINAYIRAERDCGDTIHGRAQKGPIGSQVLLALRDSKEVSPYS